MALFRDMVCYQEEVRDPSASPRCSIASSRRPSGCSAPAQINIPRDYWTQVIDIELPAIVAFERPAGRRQGDRGGGQAAVRGQVPGHPVRRGRRHRRTRSRNARRWPRSSTRRSAATTSTTTAFPAAIASPRSAGLQRLEGGDGADRQGRRGAGAGHAAQSVLDPAGLRHRLLAEDAKIIQVDINADRIGLTKPVTVGICGDAKLVAKQILAQLSPSAGNAGREERKALIHTTKSAWLQHSPAWITRTMIPARPGTQTRASAMPTACRRGKHGAPSRRALPKDAIISSDIGNNCAIGNAYPTFEQGRKYLAPGLFGPCGYGFPSIIGAKIGNPDTPVVGFAGDGAFGISMNEMSSIGRKEWPGITMVIFRNYQWGAEKRNTILWFDDNFVGTELDPRARATQRWPKAAG